MKTFLIIFKKGEVVVSQPKERCDIKVTKSKGEITVSISTYTCS